MSFMVVRQNKGQDRAVKKGVSFYENDFAGGGTGKGGLQPALYQVKQTPRNRLRRAVGVAPCKGVGGSGTKSAQPGGMPKSFYELLHHLRPVSP